MIDIRNFDDVVKLRDQISSRSCIKLHTEKNYKWCIKKPLPILNRDEPLDDVVTLCKPSTEPRQKQAFIATLGAPGSGKTTFLHYVMDKLPIQGLVRLFVTFNGDTALLHSEYEELQDEKKNNNFIIRRIFFSYFCDTNDTSWGTFCKQLGEISIDMNSLFLALCRDRYSRWNEEPFFLLAMDEVVKLNKERSLDRILSHFFSEIDCYATKHSLKIIMTTLDGQLLFKQFNSEFRVLQNGICQSETGSSRIMHWVKLPSLPFDRTYTEFVTLLKWTDPEKLAHLRVAIAMCLGHPRSLNMLYDVITSYPDDPKVWIWIDHLITRMPDG